MNRARYIIACFIVILCCNELPAQSIYYKKFTSRDGLTSSALYRICKDKDGFLWGSTDLGVVRFDGYTFINFPFSLFHGTTLGLVADKNGGVWAVGQDTALYHITASGVKEIILKDGGLRGTSLTLKADEKNRLWLYNIKHHISYIKDRSVYHYIIRDGKGDEINCNDIYTLRDSSVLFATDRGIYKLDKNDHIALLTKELGSEKIFSIANDPSGLLYFGSTGKIYRYDSEGNITVLAIADNKNVLDMDVQDSSRIWFTSDLPIVFLLERGIETDFSKYLDLQNIFIPDIFCDTNGNIFLATLGKGLHVFKYPNIINYGEHTGLNGNNVFAIARDKYGNFYIGGIGKINVLKDGKMSVLDKVPIEKGEKINTIFVNDDDVWIGTSINIFTYNIASKKVTDHKQHGALCFARGDNGDILAGGYDEYHVFNHNKKYPPPPITEIFQHVKKGARITSILHPHPSEYWFGTTLGVIRYNDGIWKQYFFTEGPINSMVHDIKKDDQGTIWIASVRGLISYDSNGRWRKYSMADGLPDSFCISIAMKGSKLWVSTIHGLAEYNGTGFKNCNEEDALPPDPVFKAYADSNSLWIGTVTGLYQRMYRQTDSADLLPKVLFTSIRLGKNPLPITDTIVVSHNNSPLLFEYVSVEYLRQENVVYEYHLKENDKNWYETPGRSLPLTSLSPGTYKLEIRAKIKNHNARSAPASVTIIVRPPFWQKPWFIVFCVLFVGIILTVALQWRIKRIKHAEKLKSQRYTRLLQLKQQATNALISPHFIFNSLNSIQYFINRSDTRSANKYLTKFAGLIRATMENSTRLNIKLGEEIKMLELYLSLETLRLNGKLTYSIKVDEDLDMEKIMIPSMLIQPYVENAVWHGITPKKGNGNITVEIMKGEEHYLIINITDDGLGIENTNAKDTSDRKHWGVKINQERFDAIEQLTGHKVGFRIKQLYTITGEKEGTQVSIALPVRER